MGMRLAGVRLTSDGIAHAHSPLVFVDAGDVTVQPGDRVEIERDGAALEGIVFVAPEQIVLAQVEASGRVLARMEPASDFHVQDAIGSAPTIRGADGGTIDPSEVGLVLPGDGLPCLGQSVVTAQGGGTVVKLDVTKRLVTVQLDAGDTVILPGNVL